MMADLIFERRNDDGTLNIKATAEAYWQLRDERRCSVCGAPGFPVCSQSCDFASGGGL